MSARISILLTFTEKLDRKCVADLKRLLTISHNLFFKYFGYIVKNDLKCSSSFKHRASFSSQDVGEEPGQSAERADWRALLLPSLWESH